MADAASMVKRVRGETGAYCRSLRTLGLCAAIPPLLFLGGCSVASKMEPILAAASPGEVESGEPAPKGSSVEKPGKSYKVAGTSYVPGENPTNYSAQGLASWYGSSFHGRPTANGEIFDRGAISAAHPTLPLPSYARVTNVSNGKSMVVRVNDRGPFHGNRAIDVSQRVAEILNFKHTGMARVRIDYIGPASLKGSDDAKLMATYREDGHVPETAVAALDAQSDIAGLYQDPIQSRLAAAHQIPQGTLRGAFRPSRPLLAAAPRTNAPQTSAAPPAAPHEVAQASATAKADAPGVTPTAVASRIESGFGGMATPQPFTSSNEGALGQPILSGFAFEPTAFGNAR